MILIEPAIQKKFGQSALKKREIAGFLKQAVVAAELAGSVSVLLTGDEEIQRLNRLFRNKDKATDVLSFPALHVDGAERVAGDLAISVETAAREAERRGHPLAVELKVLLLHGVLHLAGWDHEADSGEMAEKEDELRRRFGLEQGLIDRTQGTGLRAQAHVPETGHVAPKSKPPTLSQRTRKDGAPGSGAPSLIRPKRGKKR